MSGFDEEVVAAAFDVAALPPGPLALEPLAPCASGRRYLVGELTLVERPGDRWAVRDLRVHGPVRYLAVDSTWSTEGGSGPEWEAAYWHDLSTAIRLARTVGAHDEDGVR